MKILGVACSPRVGGNTEVLVRRALESAEREGAQVEFWSSVGKKIEPCNHCGSCLQTSECVINDDMQGLYRKMIEADGIILGSPVYFYTVNAQAKLVIDRTYALRRPINKLRGKVGGAITVAGRRGQVSALTVMNTFFLAHGMVPIGLGVEGRASNKGDVNNDERALTDATELGKTMAEHIRQRM